MAKPCHELNVLYGMEDKSLFFAISIQDKNIKNVPKAATIFKLAILRLRKKSAVENVIINGYANLAFE